MIDLLLRRLSVRRRIVGGFSLLVLLVAAMIPVVIVYHNFMNNRIQHITQIDAPANRLISHAATRVMSSRVNLLRYFQDYLPSAWPAVEDVDQAGNLLKEARDLMTTPEQKSNVISVLEILNNYKELIQSDKIDTVGTERFEATRHVFLTLKTGNSIAQMIEKIIADNEKRIAITNQVVLANTKEKLLIIIAGFAFVISFSLVLAFAVARSITRPVSELRLGADEFRQGNLGINIPTGGNDELSLLAHTFNSMAKNLNNTTVSRDLLAQEISERKKTEEALKKSEATLKSIFRVAPIGIGLVSERILLWVNEHLCSMLGRARDGLEGQSARMLYPSQEDYDWVGQEKYNQIREQGTGTVETRWQREDGGIIDVLMSSTPLDTSDLSVGVTFTALDITERKRAEEELQKLASVIKYSSELVNLATPDGKMIFLNEAGSKMLGIDLDEIDRVYIMEVIPDHMKELVQNELLPALMQGNTWEGELQYRNIKTGDLIDVYARTFTVREPNTRKTLFLANVSMDITDRKLAEEEKKKLEAQLQQSQRMEAIGTLAGGVAHDLNNILSGIVSYPELILMDLPEGNPLRKPILTIQKSGEKAAVIVQDLLTLARRGVAITDVVNLNQIISEQLKSPEFEKLSSFHHDVQVKTDLETDLLNIKGSSTHLSKSIMNIISNAAEAMPDGGTILISTENLYLDRPIKGYNHVKSGEYVTVTVSDTGLGIPKEDLKRIFEPFYTKKVMGRSGTGLGMAVVWGTVKDHKGYIDIQSTIGKGTTFTLYFPVTRKEIAKDESLLPIVDYMGKGELVLVVDDVEEQREIATGMLRKLGYSVTSVSSGEEAVEYLKKKSADLIVLDMIMEPGMNGRETYERVIKYHPNQKAIIASGFSETEDVKAAQILGVGEYIKKPYTLEKIGIAVRDELKK